MFPMAGFVTIRRPVRPESVDHRGWAAGQDIPENASSRTARRPCAPPSGATRNPGRLLAYYEAGPPGTPSGVVPEDVAKLGAKLLVGSGTSELAAHDRRGSGTRSRPDRAGSERDPSQHCQRLLSMTWSRRESEFWHRSPDSNVPRSRGIRSRGSVGKGGYQPSDGFLPARRGPRATRAEGGGRRKRGRKPALPARTTCRGESTRALRKLCEHEPREVGVGDVRGSSVKHAIATAAS
jgi:hypothetical protein